MTVKPPACSFCEGDTKTRVLVLCDPEHAAAICDQCIVQFHRKLCSLSTLIAIDATKLTRQ